MSLMRKSERTGLDAAVAGSLLTRAQLATIEPRHLFEAAIRARCQAVMIDGQTVLCRMLGRYKLYVDSRDEGLAPHLMLDGYWEMWCSEFMLRHVKDGQVAIDVGANLGYYTVLLAELVGPRGKVFAVEPNPRLAELCEKNIAVNGFWRNTQMVPLAASDRTGVTLRLQARVSDPKNGRVLPDEAPIAPMAGVLDLAVQATRLDDLVPGAADFIKIDVEGAEEQVWNGMQGLLDRSPHVTVLMEFNAQRCLRPRQTLAEIAGRFPLRELGLDGVVRSLDPADVPERTEDTLLLLSRDAL
jgi:FkbM family methyltransferase